MSDLISKLLLTPEEFEDAVDIADAQLARAAWGLVDDAMQKALTHEQTLLGWALDKEQMLEAAGISRPEERGNG